MCWACFRATVSTVITSTHHPRQGGLHWGTHFIFWAILGKQSTQTVTTKTTHMFLPPSCDWAMLLRIGFLRPPQVHCAPPLIISEGRSFERSGAFSWVCPTTWGTPCSVSPWVFLMLFVLRHNHRNQSLSLYIYIILAIFRLKFVDNWSPVPSCVVIGLYLVSFIAGLVSLRLQCALQLI